VLPWHVVVHTSASSDNVKIAIGIGRERKCSSVLSHFFDDSPECGWNGLRP
jgi:hypothetical protein